LKNLRKRHNAMKMKIVQIKNNNRIARSIAVNIPDGMINQGKIETSSQLAKLIKDTLKNNKINSKSCSLCLSGSEIIVRELKLPAMGEDQIMDNIKHELTSFLPLNHDEYCIDYKILEYIPSTEGTAGSIRILVAAVPNKIVQNYIDTLKKRI
jgi:type IV pilus assembly protein PilM